MPFTPPDRLLLRVPDETNLVLLFFFFKNDTSQYTRINVSLSYHQYLFPNHYIVVPTITVCAIGSRVSYIICRLPPFS